jgi:hypothetical protein
MSTALVTVPHRAGAQPARAAFASLGPRREPRGPCSGPRTRSGRRYPGFKRSPLHRRKRHASTPGRRPPKRLSTFGAELPQSALVPPLSFLPTSTVFSASTPCGSVAPRSRPWGSPCFELRSPLCRNRASNDAVPDGATPFGAFPPTTAVPCRHGLLPPRRSDGLGHPVRRASTSLQSWGPSADLEVFLRSRIRCMHLGVAAELQLDAPLGFIP